MKKTVYYLLIKSTNPLTLDYDRSTATDGFEFMYSEAPIELRKLIQIVVPR